MEKDTISPDQNLDNENIFEDFATDDALGEEIKTHEENTKKDVYYYLKIFSGILKIWNAFLLIFVGVLFVYIFIQNSDTQKNYTIFEPVCNLFLGESAWQVNGCFSVSYYLEKAQTDMEKQQQSQTSKIASLIGDIYLVDNFIYSKIVNFLITTGNNKLKPSEILSEFDALKNKYEPIDKSKITCSNITIRTPGIMEARCEAFSSDWDTQIQKVENGILSEKDGGGTSISIASSFIDFLENDPDSNFSVMEKQKVFFTTDVTGKGVYTKKTPFSLRLKYKDSQNIDF